MSEARTSEGKALNKTSHSAEGPPRLWRRLAAYMLDILFQLPYVAALVLLRFQFPAIKQWFLNAQSAQVTQFVLLTLPVFLYFALCEASSYRGTPGKRILHLSVVTSHRNRASLPQTSIRSAFKLLPWELNHAALWRIHLDPASGAVPAILLTAVWILLALYLFSAAFSPRRQTIYDLIAGTIVVSSPGE
jgi:uncharacterized RDD family membrane protein YckC